jgi:hypothetical protein
MRVQYSGDRKKTASYIMKVKLEVGRISLEHGTKAAKDEEFLYLNFTFPQTNLKVLNIIVYNLVCMCHVTAAPECWTYFTYSQNSYKYSNSSKTN